MKVVKLVEVSRKFSCTLTAMTCTLVSSQNSFIILLAGSWRATVEIECKAGYFFNSSH